MNIRAIRTRYFLLLFISIVLGLFPQAGHVSQVRFKAMSLETMIESSDVIVTAKFLGSDNDGNPFDRFQIAGVVKQTASTLALDNGKSIIVRNAHYCNALRAHRIYRDTGVMHSRIIDTYDSNRHKNLVIGKIYSLYLKQSCSKDDWEYTAIGGFIE